MDKDKDLTQSIKSLRTEYEKYSNEELFVKSIGKKEHLLKLRVNSNFINIVIPIITIAITIVTSSAISVITTLPNTLMYMLETIINNNHINISTNSNTTSVLSNFLLKSFDISINGIVLIILISLFFIIMCIFILIILKNKRMAKEKLCNRSLDIINIILEERKIKGDL